MEFLEDGDDVVSLWKPSIFYQGWLNTMHGGILSTLVDEISGWVVSRKLQTSGMTTHLDVHYRKAVSTQDPQLTIRAHITEMKRNIALINVTIHNSSGELCVEGQATYFCMNAELYGGSLWISNRLHSGTRTVRSICFMLRSRRGSTVRIISW